MGVFKEDINLIIGGLGSIFIVSSDVFLGSGEVGQAVKFITNYWLFFAFIILNIVDYGTGWYKARYTHTSNSSKGAHGIMKKVGYWIIIVIAYFLSVLFVEIGRVVGMDMGFMVTIGYFTLLTYVVNEVRSILENLVVCGVNVPTFLVKGLKVTQKLLDDEIQPLLKDDK